MLLTPPRCLTANRTQQGVLLTWIPPANHSAPIQHYVMEFRLGERWEILDDSIPPVELELLARDLIQVRNIILTMWKCNSLNNNLSCHCQAGAVPNFSRYLKVQIVLWGTDIFLVCFAVKHSEWPVLFTLKPFCVLYELHFGSHICCSGLWSVFLLLSNIIGGNTNSRCPRCFVKAVFSFWTFFICGSNGWWRDLSN